MCGSALDDNSNWATLAIPSADVRVDDCTAFSWVDDHALQTDCDNISNTILTLSLLERPKSGHYVLSLCLMPDDFTRQRRASEWERVN